MNRVFISAGSNLSRQDNMALALKRLEQMFGRVERSPLYESPPADGKGPNYYNLVLSIVTDLPPPRVREILRTVEAELGRDRRQAEAVPIDLDLLLHGDLYGDFGDFQLPHPDIFRYRHVLQPLADIAGDLRLPGTQQNLTSLLACTNPNQMLQAVAEP
ncbi:2-amino-4-hydroxy-6-hydroxymethyldihydropteridine diphosphokinase [Gilvimarinus sp. F26214L]|uniref:2-amino-4-hydroxy-6- hydroxymethyldihydropteridine diphosphokinase n=1 Tax=Gilvimarinus sp. DZF01 TaxID=3461371 RepID=UPI00404660CF